MDSYTKLLLHCDGADASTVFIDDCLTEHIITANATAQIDTAQSKFGGASGYFPDSSGSYLSTPDSDDWYFGTGDFTIDCWVRFNSISGNQVFISQDDGGNNRFVIYKTSGGAIEAYWIVGGVTRAYFTTTSTGLFATNTWYHIAIVRSGSDEYIFLDGTSKALTYTTNPNSSTDFPNLALTLWIGKNFYGNYVNGWLDEFRVSKGIARWTTNFTPPTSAYSNPSFEDYKLLLHCNGADGATSFPDDSTYGKTVTANGNAQVDTGILKLGSGTCLLDGAGDYLSLANSTDWNFGTGDFTIDCWIYFDGTLPPGGFRGIVGASLTGSGGNAGWNFWINTDKKIRFTKDYTYFVTSTTLVAASTWYHVAVVRSGDNLYLFVNGTKEATLTGVSALSFNSGGTGITIGRYYPTYDDFYFDGNIDEVRILKGVAAWTSDFTPPTEEYTFHETLSISETITLSDAWTEQVNPESQGIGDSLFLDDSWEVFSNPEQENIFETITLDDSWTEQVNPDNQSISDDLKLDDSWEALVNPEQQILSDNLFLSDNWITSLIGTFSKFINTDFRWLVTIKANISVLLSWLNAKTINTDFRWLGTTYKKVGTDFRWLALPYNTLPLSPISPNDVQIFINGTDVLLGNDVNLQTGNITHTIGSNSQASFVLARRHDDLNRTHLGVASQITNQNSVQIYIDGHLEFDGYVMTINVDSETETVAITAQMLQPADNRHSIELPLPSVNEKLHLYHCLVNAVQMDNPKEDTRAVIIGNHNRYWNGSSWVFDIGDALVFTTDILAQNYIDSYVDLTVNLIFESKQPSVTSREKNAQYYKGTKVNLGTKIQQQIDKYSELEYTGIDGKGVNATAIENGTYITKPNYTYFWVARVKNVLTGVYNSIPHYIGTSLASTTTDLWSLIAVSPRYQKIRDNIETELGYYYVGSAPYKEISTKNGQLIAVKKWQDKNDGLYNVADEAYDYVNYAKLVANLEYEKLLNVNGSVLPLTSANLEITFDAYYYYTVKLLTRINVTNTTVSDTYKNLNGFPVSVKSIYIDFGTMKITLSTDNKLSQDELDEIDAQMPDEESPLYLIPEYSALVYRKFDLKTWTYVS